MTTTTQNTKAGKAGIFIGALIGAVVSAGGMTIAPHVGAPVQAAAAVTSQDDTRSALARLEEQVKGLDQRLARIERKIDDNTKVRP